MVRTKNNAIEILRGWHKVEFFQAYNLNLEGKKVYKLDGIQRVGLNDNLLPWYSKKMFSEAKLDERKRYGFNLYLNIFDQNIQLKEVENFSIEKSEKNKLENLERLQPQGLTCFAKLWVDEFGSPSFEGFSVATLPWAMGRLVKNKLNDLNLATFNKECDELKAKLNEIEEQLKGNSKRKILDAESLTKIINELYLWAGYKKEILPSCYIECVELKGKPKEPMVNSGSNVPLEGGDEGTNVLSMPILNSFYIEDIERAIRSIPNMKQGAPLKSYLSITKEGRINLYDVNSNQSLDEIARQLAPHLMNAGRWPSPPEHNMSLMQQYALNHMFEKLKNGGLYSVNGPPGTGKTTLFRDAMAENIVQRAKKLKGLSKPQDAFFKKHRVSIGDDETTISELIPALQGFEMVVTSSNNAAVENISKELPLLKGLDSAYQEIRYLRAVGNQVNATEQYGKLQPMDDENLCWGMFSAALGKKSNRQKFIQRFFFDKYENKEDKENNRDHGLLNIWDLRNEKVKKPFNDAKTEFSEVEGEYNRCLEGLNQFSDLHAYMQENDKESLRRPFIECIESLVLYLEKLYEQLQQEQSKETEIERRYAVNIMQLEQQKRRNPWFWHCWLKTERYQSYINILETLENECIQLSGSSLRLKRSINDINSGIENSNKKKSDKEDKLKEVIVDYEKKYQVYSKLKRSFSDMRLPDKTAVIDEPDLQRNAYWQNKKVNDIRSRLFQKAIELHEAWLLEVIQPGGGFGGNLVALSKLLQGKKITDIDAERMIWRSLFLVVPVISTTFASFFRQFTVLKEGDLGWLFIDEAGQAIPQAAVGALMRAKRAVVVGDPLQVEPVFTAPSKFVEHLMESELAEGALDWSPNIVSVQQLADRVNLHGSYIEKNGVNTWLGSPLLVHRRCINPMFNIANAIAYDNRMIQGLDASDIRPKEDEFLGESAWIHVDGECSERQFVASHAEVLVKILQHLYLKEQRLPIVYIISPFKAVKQQLLKKMSTPDSICSQPNQDPPELKTFKKWKEDCFGTVHTFQGKECVKVLLVLGCDNNNSGGAYWASSKPNLLNVAVTRAKKQFYIIGNKNIWATKNYFKEAARNLKAVDSDDFL